MTTLKPPSLALIGPHSITVCVPCTWDDERILQHALTVKPRAPNGAAWAVQAERRSCSEFSGYCHVTLDGLERALREDAGE